MEGVYSVHDWAEVHRLHERQGLSKTVIARRLAMSRNTVDRLLGHKDLPRYQRRSQDHCSIPSRPTSPNCSRTTPKRRPPSSCSVLQGRGYGGRITILKDYLKDERPRYLARTYRRISYVPGEIGQLDWWDVPVVIPVGRTASGSPTVIATLPHSAAHETVFTFTRTMGDFCSAFVSTLERLIGVPEAGVFDNDSSIVAQGSGKYALLHDEVAALFGYVRLRPIILEKELPVQGQAERTVGYLETSFLPLRSFTSIEDLQCQHDDWAKDMAHPRYHRRVGSKVIDTYNVERDFLARLPQPLSDTDRLSRLGGKDLFIRVGDADSIPPGAQRTAPVGQGLAHRGRGLP